MAYPQPTVPSAGKPSFLSKVALFDDHDNEVPVGTPGEICVRSPTVFLGYWGLDDDNAYTFRNGWHHTGDIGVMSDDGYITIVDRKKDMIISDGFNVFPNEIEQVLTAPPAVQDCAVVGVPDEKWGEAVKAVVQLKAGLSCDPEELQALVKNSLGSVKSPKSIDFVDQLPRSPVGKVLKAEIRKKYWQGQSRAVN